MIEAIFQHIFWLGHDSFRIDATSTIYVDPYDLPDNSPAADIVLVTHEHFDHCSPADIAKIQKDQTIIFTEKDSAAKLSGDVRTMKPGDTSSVSDIQITAVPAYNIDKQFHPKINGWLGFIVELEGVRVYHAGDTDFIPEMGDLEVDIALLPVSGTYVMNVEQAVRAAGVIKPKIAVPMHFGAIVGSQQDAESFKGELEGLIEVRILEKT